MCMLPITRKDNIIIPATYYITIINIIIIITYIYYALLSSVMFSNTRMNLKREAVYD